jgi:hypothetical protein
VSGLAAIGIVYAVGVVWCLLLSDAKPATRIVLAVLWPIGPLAFVVTLTILIAAAVIAYPLVMVPVGVALAALWWAFA